MREAPRSMGALGALLVIVTVSAAACSSPARGSAQGAATGVVSAGLGEQSHEAGAVTVAASWIAGTASARVALDTHSVDLDGFDLRGLARVRLDGGGWITPSAWDAPRGGHHRAGTLNFGSLEPKALASAQLVELEIRDVGVPSHVLRWERAP